MNLYTSVEQKGNSILLRGYRNGNRIAEKIPYKPHLYTETQEETEWKSYYGSNVKKKVFNNISSAKEYLEQYKDVSNFGIFGTTDWVTQYICDEYEGDIDFDIKKLKIHLLDIETKVSNGFPSPSTASEEILLITIHDYGTNKTITWGTREISSDNKLFSVENAEWRCFPTEKAMLKNFLVFWATEKADIVSGWNSEFFDIPYICNRIKNLFGEDIMKSLSPWGNIQFRDVETMMGVDTKATISGLSHLDYLQLYKKFNPGSKESFKLDFIAELELGENKVDLPGESFEDSYTNHWETFVYYNVVDVLLLRKLELKKQLIQLCLTVAYLSRVNFEDVLSASATWTSYIYNHFKKKKVAEDIRSLAKPSRSVPGAYVHAVKPGKYKWTVSIDAESLYPCVMIMNNISPETYRGKKEVTPEMILSGNFPKVPDGYIMSGNGVITTKEFKGFIPIVTQEVFDLRKTTKKLMLSLSKELEEKRSQLDGDDINVLSHKIDSLDVKQKAVKVMANSLYGCYAMQYFKYYDPDLAEAITLTGQYSTRFAMHTVNESLNKALKTSGVEYAFYGDTDSVYLTLDKVVELKCKGKNDKEIVNFLERFVFEVIQPIVNKALDSLTKKLGVDDNRLNYKLEGIGPISIFKAKKMYAFDILYNEGVRYEEAKTKVMGLEIVRSSTPAVVKEYLKTAVKICLREDEQSLQRYVKEVKNSFMNAEIYEIAFPRGVNNLAKYSSSTTIYTAKTPIHVRASLLYNFYLSEYNLGTKYPLIGEGDKVKFIYLKVPNTLREDVIAFPGKIIPKEFDIEKYVDKETQFRKTFIEPLNNILESIGWGWEERVSMEDFF